MNTLVKRGFSIYRIFLKNKLAMSVMMLVSGVMMLIGALNGRGNDTVTMPLGITAAGAAFTFWGFYRIGYIKSSLDKAETETERKLARAGLTIQILEGAIYFVVAVVGIYLLINHDVMDMMLNLMTGFFTTLNGVTGVVTLIKNRNRRDMKWWIRVVLTGVELVVGPYFLLKATDINHGWFMAAAIITTAAGVLEVISALTPEILRSTKEDGKDIMRILKDGDAS